jgi:hypothetical protein
VVLNGILLSIWIAATCLVDFMVVPLVFKHTPDMMKAGLLAVDLFKRFNIVELVLSLLLGLNQFYLRKNLMTTLLQFMLSIFLFLLISFFLFWLSPSIEATANVIISAGTTGAPSESLAYFNTLHSSYVTLDSVKLLVLLISFSLTIRSLKQKDMFV